MRGERNQYNQSLSYLKLHTQISEIVRQETLSTYYLKIDFYRNMPQNIPSTPSRQPDQHKTATVVPIDFATMSAYQTASVKSPRSTSRTKIRLVSPMRKIFQSAFMSKTNQTTYPNHTHKTVLSPKNTVQIELGGRNRSKNKENTLQKSCTNNNQSPSQLNCSNHFKQKKQASPFIQAWPYTPLNTQIQSGMSSPDKAAQINYKTVSLVVNQQAVVNHQAACNFIENKASFTFTHIRRGSTGIEVAHTKPTLPTQLQIREQNVIEQLKESYQSDINDIKKLKQEIEHNNQEIKKLLKSSRVLAETTKSKTPIERPPQRSSIKAGAEPISKVASVDGSRQLKWDKEEKQQQLEQSYKQKDKPICSKKTLINTPDFQAQETSENLENRLQAQQDKQLILPILNHQSSQERKTSQRQLKLALNNVCQLQYVASSLHQLYSEAQVLSDSIIGLKQKEFVKLQSRKFLEQAQDMILQNSRSIQNFCQVREQSLKMISSLRSLTKAVYESDVKQKSQKMFQSITSLNKFQLYDSRIENIVPVSQKQITFQKQKSQAAISIQQHSSPNSNTQLPSLQMPIAHTISISHPNRKLYPYLNKAKVDEPQVNEGKVNEGKVNEPQVSEGKVNEGKVSEGKVNEPQVSEGKVNEGQQMKRVVESSVVQPGVVSKKQGRKINNIIYL